MKNSKTHKLVTLLFFVLFLLFSSFYKAQLTDERALNVLEEIQPLLAKNPDSAIILARKVLLNNNKKEIITHTLINISISKCLLGEKDSAIYYGKRATEIGQKTGDSELISRTYGNLSSQYRNSNLYSRAKTTINEGLKHLKKTKINPTNNWLEAAFIREHAKINYLEGKTDSAIYFSDKALNILNLNKDSELVLDITTYASLYNDLSEYYFEKKDLKTSEEYALKAINKSKGTTFEKLLKNSAYLNLSQIYYYNNEPQRAIDSLKIIEANLSDKEFPVKLRLYTILAKSYYKINDLNNYEKYNESADRIEKELTEEELIVVNRTISLLNEQHQLTIQNSKTNKKIIFITLAISIFALLGLFILYQKKRKKEKESFNNYVELLNARNKELQKTETPKEEKSQLHISSEMEEHILQQLEKFEQEKKYKNPNLTRYNLSSEFQTNTKYLSEVISKHKSCNFNTYINELRINDICSLILNNPQYRKYKIAYLSEISGFNSPETFARAFKKVTGITPSIFIENATEN